MVYWKIVLIYWLVVHFLIEFTVYPAKTDNLYSRKKLLVIHTIIYGVAMLGVMWFLGQSISVVEFFAPFFVSPWYWKNIGRVWWIWWIVLLLVRGVFVYLHFLQNIKTVKNNKIMFLIYVLQHVCMLVLLMIACYEMNYGKGFFFRKWLYEYKILALLCLMFLMVWDVASSFVKQIFSLLHMVSDLSNQVKYTINDSSRKYELTNRSNEFIGKLERILVIVLILSNQFTGIGFVLAAKGVARVRIFEDKDATEYYMIGTFVSFTYAIIVGLLGRWFLKQMNCPWLGV